MFPIDGWIGGGSGGGSWAFTPPTKVRCLVPEHTSDVVQNTAVLTINVWCLVFGVLLDGSRSLLPGEGAVADAAVEVLPPEGPVLVDEPTRRGAALAEPLRHLLEVVPEGVVEGVKGW